MVARISMGTSLFYYGLQCTSVTFAANVNNVIPVVTFIFAWNCKVGGTLVCVGGATIICLYKGPAFNAWGSHVHHATTSKASLPMKNWTCGSLFLVGSCLSLYALFIVQAKLLLIFPSKFTATALTCFMASIQSFVMGLERSFLVWRLHIDLQLLTIVYSGVLVSGASFCLIAWCVERRGPTCFTMFNPILLVFVDIFRSLFQGEVLYARNIIGSILIIGGLYAFLWGRKRSIINKGNNDKEICIQDSQEAVRETRDCEGEGHKMKNPPHISTKNSTLL
ncbi:hypothetical protein AMTRI_Chr09g37450 [Amborella trichopoda]